MRRAFASLVLFCSCAGPTQQQLAESPATQPPPRHAEAPAATASEQDRTHLVQSFDDMQTTQQARREVETANRTAPPPTAVGAAQPTQGQAEEAPPPKKKGVAEQR